MAGPKLTRNPLGAGAGAACAHAGTTRVVCQLPAAAQRDAMRRRRAGPKPVGATSRPVVSATSLATPTRPSPAASPPHSPSLSPSLSSAPSLGLTPGLAPSSQLAPPTQPLTDEEPMMGTDTGPVNGSAEEPSEGPAVVAAEAPSGGASEQPLARTPAESFERSLAAPSAAPFAAAPSVMPSARPLAAVPSATQFAAATSAAPLVAASSATPLALRQACTAIVSSLAGRPKLPVAQRLQAPELQQHFASQLQHPDTAVPQLQHIGTAVARVLHHAVPLLQPLEHGLPFTVMLDLLTPAGSSIAPPPPPPPPPPAGFAHQTEQSIELLYVLSGEGELAAADGSVRRVRPGDSILAWAGTTQLQAIQDRALLVASTSQPAPMEAPQGHAALHEQVHAPEPLAALRFDVPLHMLQPPPPAQSTPASPSQDAASPVSPERLPVGVPALEAQGGGRVGSGGSASSSSRSSGGSASSSNNGSASGRRTRNSASTGGIGASGSSTGHASSRTASGGAVKGVGLNNAVSWPGSRRGKGLEASGGTSGTAHAHAPGGRTRGGRAPGGAPTNGPGGAPGGVPVQVHRQDSASTKVTRAAEAGAGKWAGKGPSYGSVLTAEECARIMSTAQVRARSILKLVAGRKGAGQAKASGSGNGTGGGSSASSSASSSGDAGRKGAGQATSSSNDAAGSSNGSSVSSSSSSSNSSSDGAGSSSVDGTSSSSLIRVAVGDSKRGVGAGATAGRETHSQDEKRVLVQGHEQRRLPPPGECCVLMQRAMEEFVAYRFPHQTNKLAFVFDPSELDLPLSFGVEVFESGHHTPIHVHTNAHELFFVLAGQGDAYCDGHHLSVGPGDVVVFPPGSKHGLDNNSPDKLYCLQLMAPNQHFVEYVKTGTHTGRLDDEDLCNLTNTHC